MSGRLDGLGIVITRPRAAAEPLARALEREGARAFVFPALEIEDVAPSGATLSALAGLATASLAIFVSANAAERGVALARSAGAWREDLCAAAIGEATAESLRNSGLREVISPAGRHDSEALLALPRLQAVRGENIIIFRGEGGREHLREVLEARGARVAYAECYRRIRPRSDPAPLLEAWARGEVHAVSALSAETLANFVGALGERGSPLLRDTLLLVPHEAVAAHPDARRFGRRAVTPPGAAGIIETLSQLRVNP